MIDTSDGRSTRLCDRCHDSTVAWVEFAVLVGNKIVCEQCVAEVLGLGRLPYKPEVLADVARRQQPWRQRLKTLWEG